jgi:hypothetical protein
MTSLTKVHNIGALAVAALLLAAAVVVVGLFSAQSGGPVGVSVAHADEGDDKGERAINRFRGNGRKACSAAKKRTRGGICTRVVEDRDDRERYEVSVRTRSYRYKIDLSRSFRVLDVDRDRIGGDRDSDNDSDSDSDGDSDNDD